MTVIPFQIRELVSSLPKFELECKQVSVSLVTSNLMNRKSIVNLLLCSIEYCKGRNFRRKFIFIAFVKLKKVLY